MQNSYYFGKKWYTLTHLFPYVRDQYYCLIGIGFCGCDIIYGKEMSNHIKSMHCRLVI